MKNRIYYILIGMLLFAGCANRGIGPQGGPKDSIPPKPLYAVPEMGALNFSDKSVVVTFDEYIELDNVMSNLMMSPPQSTPPEVKARGKRLVIKFQDTLRENTTYTIDFGDAVCDYRERVPLHGFSYYFSTGAQIDTLEYNGRVFDAQTLNPVYGILVGIYENMADSTFEKEPFLRVCKTDSAGVFHIRNMHEGTYRLYALDDVSRDYRLTVSEALAFADEPIHVGPETNRPERRSYLTDSLPTDSFRTASLPTDSLLTDSLRVDSTAAVAVPPPLPPLFLFKEEQQRLYLQRTTRPERHKILFSFSSSPDSLPQFRATTDSLNYLTKFNARGDTATIWLLDSMSITRDSLFFETRYRRTDSLFHPEWATDTVRAIWREPRLTAKAREAQERKNRNRRLELKSNARKNFEIYDTLVLRSTTPIASVEKDSIHLFEKIDTVLRPMAFTIAEHDSFPMTIAFLADLQPDGKYELRIDSGAIHDIYGVTHIAGGYALQLKTLKDYSTLRVKLGPSIERMRIQVLDAKDNVIRELPATAEGALFEYLKPDVYYLRCYEDKNGDGQWTTGAWAEKRQPEPVYYFPEKIQTKSNWDFEEEWDYTALEQTASKPQELIKASANGKKK